MQLAALRFAVSAGGERSWLWLLRLASPAQLACVAFEDGDKFLEYPLDHRGFVDYALEA